jgi:ubiquinone/menaquinone biosynthesis C-methylase UbiE
VTTCDVRKLPFADQAFDLIVSDSTLDHYQSKADIEISLKELVRVLRPGGTLIITLDNGSNFTEPLFRLWIALGLSPFYIGKTYTIKELEKVLTRMGMSVIDRAALIHNPRFFAKFISAVLHKIQPHRAKDRVKKLLDFFDNLGNKKTRYLTAQFIGIKAVKP